MYVCKASMVQAYMTWKDFALVPESKISRLVQLVCVFVYVCSVYVQFEV